MKPLVKVEMQLPVGSPPTRGAWIETYTPGVGSTIL